MSESIMINKLLSIFALTLINAYKYLISPFLGNNCRFLPTCSEYMKDSIVKHGFISGVWMGLKRISKCHPWGKKGYDPVK